MNATAEQSRGVADRVLARLLPLLGATDREIVLGQRFLERATRAALYGQPTLPEAPHVGSQPRLEQEARRIAGDARPGLATAVALTKAVSRLAVHPADGADRDADAVFTSGAATPIERARLLAALCRVSGLAARLCLLYRDQPPDFHAVCEIGIMGRWSLFDPLANQFFHLSHVGYASAWDIMNRPAIVDGHPEYGRKPTIDSSFYRVVAVADLAPGS